MIFIIHVIHVIRNINHLGAHSPGGNKKFPLPSPPQPRSCAGQMGDAPARLADCRNQAGLLTVVGRTLPASFLTAMMRAALPAQREFSPALRAFHRASAKFSLPRSLSSPAFPWP